MIFRPDKTKSIDCYVDAFFSGEWNTTWSDEPSLTMSQTGYIIQQAILNLIHADYRAQDTGKRMSDYDSSP